MAAPLYNPLLGRLTQTTNTAARAARLLQDAFPLGAPSIGTNPDVPAGDTPPSPRAARRPLKGNSGIAVPLPRRDVPTYVLPNQTVQPWELLPMKAAAQAEYPNFFNASCAFFGSIKRDVTNDVPFCLLRPTKLALDLAKLSRNLGIVDGFDIVQSRRRRLGPDDFVWTPDMPEPRDVYDVALFKHRLIRLHLRTDMYSLLPRAAPALGPAAPSSPSSPAPSSSAPALPAGAQLAPAFGLLPLSVRNVSKASQPVLMYPSQLAALRERLGPGLLVGYHPELGLTLDAAAEAAGVPVLVAAHVGLPLGQAVAVRGAVAELARAEAGRPLRHRTKLKDWNMVEDVRRRLAERRAALASALAPPEAPQQGQGQQGRGAGEGAAALAGEGGPEAPGPRKALQVNLEAVRAAATREAAQARAVHTESLQTVASLRDQLLAWQLLRSGALGAAGERAADGTDGEEGDRVEEGREGASGEAGRGERRRQGNQGGRGGRGRR
ncbi:hypothetical protein HYH03_004674 [Edaphochlamys debaryana]|uniref:Uncharacterized protein n=1 Tax=Edaphochlamys debaryana TaxID=47281 RepID=A0A835YB11_9CHLO|nr:hypothetical protein HYH03_004674 [Edaphochlamys debaryana]|eukprot:KAG2497526.1 hypothetical protein HYH03_004674 [Edaphochlamys debaryana]